MEDKMTLARIKRQVDKFGSECVRVFETMEAVEFAKREIGRGWKYIEKHLISVSKDDETYQVAVATEETWDALEVLYYSILLKTQYDFALVGVQKKKKTMLSFFDWW